MKRIYFSVACLLAFAVNSSAGETGFVEHIRPIFQEKCSGCHGGDAPEYGVFEENKAKFVALSKGPKMDSYAHLVSFTAWPDAGALMRRLDDGRNTKDGKPGNMYHYLGADDAERQKNLKLFKEWVGNWVLKRWPDMTKEDLNGIKVKY